jgi:hypothetical protein
VARHEVAVAGRDQIGFDEVGAEVDRELVRRERVLGAIAGGAAVAQDQGPSDQRAIAAVVAPRRAIGVGPGAGRRRGRDQAGGQEQREAGRTEMRR